MQRPGDRIGEYLLQRPLGAGGFGAVWLAAHEKRGEVAVKILHREMLEHPSKDRGPSVVDRFLAEARIIARLDHPGLVQIYDLIDDRQNGIVAYVMEKLEGCDLTKIGERLDLETVLDVFAEVADTLTFLHAEGVIHRDVTPRNIFVCDPEQGRPRPCRVKLLDFGTAKELYATSRLAQTGTGILLGALRSMAPESFLPRVTPTPAIDQWGFGVAMYVCLTGRAPFDHVSLAELVRQIEHDAPPKMTLLPRFEQPPPPQEIEAIVRRLLEKKPEDRYPSIQDAAKALRSAARAFDTSKERTVFDPFRLETEPDATPHGMNLSPPLKLAQVMFSRPRTVAKDGPLTMAEILEVHTVPDNAGGEETIPLGSLESVTRLDAPPYSIDASDLRPTLELDVVPEPADPSMPSVPSVPSVPVVAPAKIEPLMPPPNTVTMRAIEELAALSQKPPTPPPRVLAPPPARAPKAPEKKTAPAWLKNLLFALLLLAATALGWMIRDFVS